MWDVGAGRGGAGVVWQKSSPKPSSLGKLAGPPKLGFWLARGQNVPALLCSLGGSRVSLWPIWVLNAREQPRCSRWVQFLARVGTWNVQTFRDRKSSYTRIFAFSPFETLRNRATRESAGCFRWWETERTNGHSLIICISDESLFIANKVTK